MRNMRNWAWFMLFGSLWGLSEVAAGGSLYANEIPHASIFLTAWAVLILAAARGVFNHVGSSVVIGGIATLFKLVNAGPFICHLLGIFMLGVAFEIAAGFLIRKDSISRLRTALAGLVSVYGGYALFALVITYVIRYDIWVAGGLTKVVNHIFVSGSIAALLAAAIVPFGFRLGINSGRMLERRPRWAAALSVLGILVFWILARVVV